MLGELHIWECQLKNWRLERTYECDLGHMVDDLRESKEKYPQARYRLVLIVIEA